MPLMAIAGQDSPGQPASRLFQNSGPWRGGLGRKMLTRSRDLEASGLSFPGPDRVTEEQRKDTGHPGSPGNSDASP